MLVLHAIRLRRSPLSGADHMMYEANPFECSRIAQDLQIRKVQVESVMELFNEGNTVPFITRYRKERTGGLDEDVIRQIQARLNSLKQLSERKQTILKSIENQGKLTDALRHEINTAATIRRLEDLYMPYKPKKKSLAAAAREKGLEPLAVAIWQSDSAAANFDELCAGLVNPEKQLNDVEAVKTGVQHIIAEMINDAAEVRAQVRRALWKTSGITSAKSDKVPEGRGAEFHPYFEFKEGVQEIRLHRLLAINRGEKEGVLKVKLDFPSEIVRNVAAEALAETLFRAAGHGEAPPAETPAPTPEGDAPPLVEALKPAPKAPLTGEPLFQGHPYRSPHVAFLTTCLHDALDRLLLPSLEREIRGELTDEAEIHAVKVFAHNIRSLLMQPPLVGKRVLAVDPGFRTGCKLAALDEFGNLLEHAVIYPHGGGPGGGRRGKDRDKEKKPAEPAATPTDASPPAPSAESAPVEAPPAAIDAPTTPASDPAPESPTTDAGVSDATPAPVETPPAAAETPVAPEPPPIDRRAESKEKITELVGKHQLNIIAIGNGTACRETEEIIAEVIAERLAELSYVIISEAGASVYSVSPLAKEEFANLDATLRSAASIGRRLQDPLSELVKIDPQSLGVGLYQHDMGRKELKESLEAVVESCVNQVGVDLNTASVPLLRYVSGLNQMVAREIVETRKTQGPFAAREQLLQVAGMGPARFTQCAGFLKIPGSPNPLDRTWIHPESYSNAERILGELGFAPSALDDKAKQEELHAKAKSVNVIELAKKLELGESAVADILESLSRPGRDPREDLPAPIFKKGILKLDDLQTGMELKGTVLNVVDFGAFVDIGLKESGLVHISQLANKYVKSPYEVVSVNDVVTVWVLKIDKDNNHVSLTMIKPGTERKPMERGQRPPRREEQPRVQEGEQAARPQHGRGGPPRDRQQGQGHGRDSGQRRDGGRPPRGRSGPPGQRRDDRPAAAVAAPEKPASPPPPPPPPPKPRREPPKAKLTQAAIEGKAPLRTLSELAAFFAAKDKPAEEKQEKPPESPPAS